MSRRLSITNSGKWVEQKTINIRVDKIENYNKFLQSL